MMLSIHWKRIQNLYLLIKTRNDMKRRDIMSFTNTLATDGIVNLGGRSYASSGNNKLKFQVPVYEDFIARAGISGRDK